MSRLLFEARAAVLALAAQERVLEKEIELAKLKTSQPAAWVGLTPERRSEIESNVLMNGGNYPEVLEAIENELREKNTGEAK